MEASLGSIRMHRHPAWGLPLAVLACVVFWQMVVQSWAQEYAGQANQPNTRQTPSAPARPTVPPPAANSPDPIEEFDFGAFLNADPGTALASVPEMFGDSFFRGGNITLVNMATPDSTLTVAGPVPVAAATRRVLVAEHNKALPVDRVYINYNHFHNALNTRATLVDTVTPVTTIVDRDFSVDQYTFGWEKTFGCGCWSAELRLPLAGRYDFDFTAPVGGETAAISGGETGNLAVILKRVLYLDCGTVVSAGVGFDLPTGDDARVVTATPVITSLLVENESVYLLPYVAVMGQPDCQRFWHSFVQFDIPLNAHEYRFETATLPMVVTGSWKDQTLLHIDIGGGYWLYRDCCCPATITGVAAIAELHYTTALDDTDVEGAAIVGAGTQSFDLRNTANRIDVINVTAGVHLELARCSTLRVATALPLRSGDGNRWFDAEVLVQLSRRF